MSEQTDRVDPALAAGNRKLLAGYRARHFLWGVKDAVATVTLDRPERKNPLTRSGDRGGSPGAGDLNDDRGFFARLPRLRGQAEAALRRQLKAQS